MKSEHRRHNAGFTLIELMVVIVILGLLAGVGSVVVLKNLADAKIDVAKAKCAEIEGAIENYEARKGSKPSPEEVIDILVEQGYLKKEKLNDPWNERYFVREDDQGNYRVYSKGEDKSEDTEDDIGATGLKSEGGSEDF